MNRRSILLGIGIGAGVLAAIETAAPGAISLPVGVVGLALIGGLLLLYATAFVLDTRQEPPVLRSELQLAQGILFDPSSQFSAPTPGDDLRTVLAQFADRRISSGDPIIERTKAIAVRTFETYTDRSPTDVTDEIESGRWLDDPYAVEFFGASHPSPPSISIRFLRLFAPGTTFWTGFSRAVDAITEVSEGRDSSRTDTQSSPRQLDRLPKLRVGRGRSDILRTSSRWENNNNQFTEASDLPIERNTNHWYGIGVVVPVSLGLGLLLGQAEILLSGVVGIVYAAYAKSTSAPEVDLSITRSVSDDEPAPGDELEVTVSVSNDSSRTLTDLRLADGVPPELVVIDGSPRLATFLRPGATEEIAYTVVAKRGSHEIGPVRAVARNLPGSLEREFATGPTSTIECVPRYEPLDVSIPLSERRARHSGPIETSTGGEGTEFYATREYRLGDPWNRIDWSRLARTGERATLEFRRERTATVVILVDTQLSAYVAPSEDVEHAVDRSVDATGRLFSTLLSAGHHTGLATFGADDEYWLAPASGTDHEECGVRDLALNPAFSSTPTESISDPVKCQRRLRRRLPDDAQLIVVTPLCDRYTAYVLKQLWAYGFPITVVSPDPTVDRTPRHRLARLTRDIEVRTLRNVGLSIVDWRWDEPLEAAVRRARRRDRRR
jgi:uncharacterized repeat protein (TIGR01451 family)